MEKELKVFTPWNVKLKLKQFCSEIWYRHRVCAGVGRVRVRKHSWSARVRKETFPWVYYENRNPLSPSSAVKPGNGILTADETHVDDIILLSLGNAIKLTAACRATPCTTLRSHLPSAVIVYILIPLNTNTNCTLLYMYEQCMSSALWWSLV